MLEDVSVSLSGRFDCLAIDCSTIEKPDPGRLSGENRFDYSVQVELQLPPGSGSPLSPECTDDLI